MSAADATPADGRTRDWGWVWRAGCAAASAVLLTSAFPPFNQSVNAWVGLAPLFVLARFTAPLASWRWGFAAGFGTWLGSLFWMLQLGRTGTYWPLAFVGWVLLAAYCALYTGMFAAVVAAMMAPLRREDERDPATPPAAGARMRRRVRNFLIVAASPLLWSGFEYLRSTFFTGFPWNQLGLSQYRNIPLIQIAEWGGVYAVSAIVVVLNALLGLMALRFVDAFRRREPGRLQFELMFGMLLFVVPMLLASSLLKRQVREPAAPVNLRIAVIQPNIPQQRKWVPGTENEIYDRLAGQTELALAVREDLHLLVYPETAVPAAPNRDEEASDFISQLGRGRVPVLIGAMEVGEGGRRGRPVLHNASLLLGRDGHVLDVYRKRHLVPFGEYLPFDRWVPLLDRFAPLGFSCTPGTTGTVLRLPALASATNTPAGAAPPDVPFSCLICFEDAFPGLARDAVRNGARVLVIQTNDAWFDPLAGSLQHLMHSVFRCVENRVPAIRAANTGVSCFIDSLGRIENVEVLEANDWERRMTGCKVSRVAVQLDAAPTFYTRYGDLPFALPCGVAALAGFALVAWREKRKNAPARSGSEGAGGGPR